MEYEKTPTNAVRPEASPENLVNFGFVHRDSPVMIKGLLALQDEKELQTAIKSLEKNLVGRRKVTAAMDDGDPLHDAADLSLLDFADVLRSLEGKSAVEIRDALVKFRDKERGAASFVDQSKSTT